MIGIKISTAGEGPPVADARDKIMDSLNVEAIVKTDMFVLAFQAPDPDFAAEVINELTAIYIEHVVSLRRPIDTAAIAKHEADRLEKDLRVAEEDLRDFTRKYNILSIDKQKDLLLDRLARLQDELANAQRAVLEADQKLEAIRARISSLPSDESLSVTTRPNPVVDRLRERLSQLETDARKFVPGSPAEAQLRVEMRGIEAQLKKAAVAVSGSQTVGTSSIYQQLQSTLALQQVERQALGVRSGFIERQLEATNSELQRLDDHELLYRELQRRVKSKEKAYLYALQKREETVIADQISGWSLSHVVPVEPATPPERASRPRRMLLLVLGLIVGLLTGIGLAYLLEFTRRTMSTPREVELALGLRVLASINRIGLFMRRIQQNEVELRRFATQLLHQRGGRPVLSLMLSSASRKSGRSTLSRRIATALRHLGADVLRIELVPTSDAKQAARIKFLDEGGNEVSDMPPGEEGPEIATVRIEAPAWDMHNQLSALLRETGETYGFILVDPPALDGFPEQLYIASMLSGVLAVIEADRTPVAAVRTMIDAFRDSDAKVLGAILNMQRHERASWAFGWMALSKRRAIERLA